MGSFSGDSKFATNLLTQHKQSAKNFTALLCSLTRFSSILPRSRGASDLICFIVRSISAPRMGGAGGKREEGGEKRDRKENEENAGLRGGSGGGVTLYIPQSFGLSGFRNVDYKPIGRSPPHRCSPVDQF
jgi:hypothetical protein